MQIIDLWEIVLTFGILCKKLELTEQGYCIMLLYSGTFLCFPMVKPVLTKVLETDGSFVQVESIAEHSAILLTCIK